MSDGMAFDLQKAMYDALLADSGVQSLLNSGGLHIYQTVPDSPVYPYATIGDDQEGDDSVEGLDASEIFADLHVWSRSNTWQEGKSIASALKRALHNANLTLANSRCVLIEHRITRNFMDADNITRHGVVTLRALTEEL
jgi:hypothetical protein